MLFKKKIFYCFSAFCLMISSLDAKEDSSIVETSLALEQAQILPCHGILKQKADGFVYLDVSNEFISLVAPFLTIPGELRLPPMAAKSLGAHISVFNKEEHVIPQELGSLLTFEIKEIRAQPLYSKDGNKELWVLVVSSPELEALRKKYGKKPKLQGNDFYITIGNQMPTAPDHWQTIEELAPHNFSNEPTLGLGKTGDYKVMNAPQVLATAEKVAAIGQLVLKNNGFVYLDVSNQFIENISPLLPTDEKFSPSSTKLKQIGAHISVFYENEMIAKKIWNLKEAGYWFTFTVKEVRYITMKNANGQKRLWLLAVESPGLERLRVQYGLKPKLNGHDFHITLGYEEVTNLTQKLIEPDAA